MCKATKAAILKLSGRSCRYARSDGRGGFASEELGQRFRAAAYCTVGLPLPAAAPHTITLLTAVDAEEVCADRKSACCKYVAILKRIAQSWMPYAGLSSDPLQFGLA